MGAGDNGEPIVPPRETNLDQSTDDEGENATGKLSDSANPSSISEERNIRALYTSSALMDVLPKAIVHERGDSTQDDVDEMAKGLHNILKDPHTKAMVKALCDEINGTGKAEDVYADLCAKHPQDGKKVHLEWETGPDGKEVAKLVPGKSVLVGELPGRLAVDKFPANLLETREAKERHEKGDYKPPPDMDKDAEKHAQELWKTFQSGDMNKFVLQMALLRGHLKYPELKPPDVQVVSHEEALVWKKLEEMSKQDKDPNHHLHFEYTAIDKDKQHFHKSDTQPEDIESLRRVRMWIGDNDYKHRTNDSWSFGKVFPIFNEDGTPAEPQLDPDGD